MKPPERFPPDDPRQWLNRAQLLDAQVIGDAYLADAT